MRLSLALALFALPAMAQRAGVNWIPPNDSPLEIDGLPWFGENGGEWFRLPVRLQNTLPKSVWSLGNSPSGGRIRFRTDANVIAIRLEYRSGPDMTNMHAFGQTGVDLYLDGLYRGTAIAKPDSRPGEPVEANLDLKGQPRVEREATIYLSLYMPVKVLAVGLDADARIRKPQPFAVSKPVVFYGTSITQGGCASRPGMSYPAILGRMLNLDFVNLGFSGAGKGEPEVARMVAEIDASAFVFDFAQNNRTVASLREVYEPFLNTVREKHPRTPIVVITPIANSHETLPETDGELQGMRALIRNVASKHIAAGDEHLQVVEGTDLLGPERADGLVDGTHPNDLGFQWMAEGLAPRLRRVLNLHP